MPTKIMTRLLAGTAVSALLTGAAFAADANARPYDIPQQDAATALQAYAMQSGKQVLFPYEAAKGKQAPQIKGDFSDQEVLALLANSAGLRVTADDGKTVTLRPQASAAAEGGDDGTVQALIVTAQKREEDIQDVPIAISAFTQEDLTRSQVAGGPDLMTQVPNFTFTKTNFSGYSIQIRGIGTQAISATTDPAVAVAFNNTPFIRNRFFEQEFYDLERVEVLRGPQGTLYGRNATAGVVNIVSAKPKYGFEAKVSADVANYSSQRLEGMVNLPLVEGKAALRIAGAWTKRDGYVRNTLTGDQTDGRNLWSSRISLLIEPLDWFRANLIYEHFEENDDRLRSGKQLCRKDPGPTEVNGVPVLQSGDPLFSGPMPIIFYTQGCLPASLYGSESFETPNGFALPYGPAAVGIGSPVDQNVDPYVNATQSRNLREIETRIKPEYQASTDTVELQLQVGLPTQLTLTSETAFSRDHIFSFEDYNRFNTRPGIFQQGYQFITPDGFYCDPQLGCSNRMMAGDLSTAKSLHFSQELRVTSKYDGPFNFSLGANFLRYDTEDKYYVFINTLNAAHGGNDPSPIGFETGSFDQTGYIWTDPNKIYSVFYGPRWLDENSVHNLTDLGRNYFLSKNPYGLLSYAVFGEANYALLENLRVTAGLRWTVDKKTAPQIPSWLLALRSYGLAERKTINQEWREPTGRIALDWKPSLTITDETLIYASYVRGYKAGGANPPPAVYTFPPICPPVCDNHEDEAILKTSLVHPETFGPEFVDAYELGAKNTLFDRRLMFNINAFFYDYTGYQISQIVDRSAVNLNFDAKVWGAELELDWRPLENARLAFKAGYENTRMADGSEAIDLIDRTAGQPGWIIKKPFPTFPSNCIMPLTHAFSACADYLSGAADWYAPNNGEGFAKDLSGNELPNAPHFTGTLTGDYSLPLGEEWIATLHSDLYYQSEAWTRVFNTPGYDKLKAYTNLNIAAIFTDEDAGWTIMAYVKNVFDRDSITGAFLNSDDTGLTTNVFLTEPRLYGLRVTRNWSGSAGWATRHPPDGHYPMRLELEGDYGRFSGGRELLAPATVALFPADHPYPLGVQNNLDWGSAGGATFTYQLRPRTWQLSASVRYGRANGDAEEHPKWHAPGGYLIAQHNPQLYFDPDNSQMFRYATTTASSEETHAIADFVIGRDFGLGASALGATSTLGVGLRYADFKSTSDVSMHGRPDLTFPEDSIIKYGGYMHRFHAHMDAAREFKGAGVGVNWQANIPIIGDADALSEVDVEFGLGGSLLWGKQKTLVEGNVHGDYNVGIYQFLPPRRHNASEYNTNFGHRRSKSASVPGVNINLGLAYTLGGLRLNSGYRWERYFGVLDAGIAERKTYDRQYDGPYFKLSVGFGG